jgi:hypothetical protein
MVIDLKNQRRETGTKNYNRKEVLWKSLLMPLTPSKSVI